MKYSKVPLSIPNQIATLEQRGLRFENKEKAAHYLSNISYYRLRAYTYPFQDNSDPSHPFIVSISFEEIIALYCFDRRLRTLVFNAIEKIEVALRTKIIYHYSIATNNSHWYEDITLYRKPEQIIRIISKLYEEIDRSKEIFIEHYKGKYTIPVNPPAWMSLEVVSIGILSQIFQNLKLDIPKKRIAKELGLPNPIILENWIHAFTDMRNLCAHHCRIWNRRFVTSPIIPYNTTYPFIKENTIYSNKLYAILCCIQYIHKIISPGSGFSQNLKILIDNMTRIELREMGFPQNWKQEELWKD